MSVCWKYGVIFFNTFLIFGYYYSMVVPAGLQNEFMNKFQNNTGSDNTSNQIGCTLCLGLGEVRYNVLFSVMRWTLAISSLPSGYMIDRLGSGKSAILLSLTSLFGCILSTIGALAHAPTSVPMYLTMVAGRSLLAIGGGSLKLIQARVVAHCFPEASFIPMAFGSIGLVGEALSFYLTPYVAATVGTRLSLWLGVVICGFSFLCAVGLVLLLQMQEFPDTDDYEKTKIPTITDIWTIPKKFWLFILAMAFIQDTLIGSQVNLPDYLESRYGYAMTVAGFITGVTCLFNMTAPILSVFLKYIDCHGVVLTTAIIWMTSVYSLLGFLPTINPVILTIAFGIGTTTITVTMWQVLIVLSPASCVGTLGGILLLMRHVTVAFTLLTSGYILEKPEVTDMVKVLHSYQNFFLMLIIMACTSLLCVVLMNVLDVRETCALNSRIGKWRKSDIESIKLMANIQSSMKYS